MPDIKSFLMPLPEWAVERVSRQDGASINQFIATAVAEKVAALEAVAFFEERRQRADFAAFDAIMARTGGEPHGPVMNDDSPD